MNYEKGVSVIVPIYNVEKYLATCLDSIINQTLKDIEIICVLDKKSSDDSEKIMLSYADKDPRIKIVRDTTGYGLGYNRNLGMQHVTKEYIGYIDSDDYIDEDYYERLYDAALLFDSDVVMTEIDIIDSSRNEVFLERRYPFQILNSIEEIFSVLLEGVCWDKVYRTVFLKKYNIEFPIKVIHEDTPFLLKVLNHCNKFVCMPGSKYYWIRNPNSLCFNPAYKEKRMDDANIVFNLILDYMEENNFEPRLAYKISLFMFERFGIWIIESPIYSRDILNRIKKMKDAAGI